MLLCQAFYTWFLSETLSFPLVFFVLTIVLFTWGMKPTRILQKTTDVQVGLVTWFACWHITSESHGTADTKLRNTPAAGWACHTGKKYLTTTIMRWIQMKMCPVAPARAQSACKSVFIMTSLALSCLNSWLRPVQLAHRPLTPTTSVLFVWAEKQLLSHCAICASIARWH